MKDKDNGTKNDFHSQLEMVYNSLPNNLIIVVLEDLNAKVGRE